VTFATRTSTDRTQPQLTYRDLQRLLSVTTAHGTWGDQRLVRQSRAAHGPSADFTRIKRWIRARRVSFTDASTNGGHDTSWSGPSGTALPRLQNPTTPSRSGHVQRETPVETRWSGSTTNRATSRRRPRSRYGDFSGAQLGGDAPLNVTFTDLRRTGTAAIIRTRGSSATAEPPRHEPQPQLHRAGPTTSH